jgi:eukaryotic-like serine/threonine-protein kinase
LDQRAEDRQVSHYRLQYRLGEGGMGEVYSAVDETLGRRVALKAIRPEQRLNADSRTRFLREARLLSQLDHPNICRVYDYFEDGDGDWLVLELIDGQNLRLAASRLDAAAKIVLAEQIAAVLVVTHAAGVVHRDLKPGNVMIADNGTVKVLDFGLARSMFLARPAAADSDVPGVAEPSFTVPEGLDVSVTHTAMLGRALVRDSASGAATEFQTEYGSVTGTVGYMSPEQARGEPGTAASDMFSFGLLLQELMTGRRPYDESLDYLTLLDKAQRGERAPAEGLTTDLAALVQRLTSGADATAHGSRDLRQAPLDSREAEAAAALDGRGGTRRHRHRCSREVHIRSRTRAQRGSGRA